MKNLYAFALALVLQAFLSGASATAQHPGWRYYGGDHYVNDMADAGEVLWLATKGGLLKMEKATGDVERFTKGNSGLLTNTILAVEVDLQHRLWVGTLGEGLFLYDGESWSRALPPEEDPTVNGLSLDSLGGVWVAGSKGVWRFADGTWTHYSGADPPFSSQGVVSNISTAADGAVWGVAGANALRFDGVEWRLMITSEAHPTLGEGNFSGLNADVNGQVWLGTLSKVAYYYEGEKWNRVEVGPPASPEQGMLLPVRGFVSDGNGGAWGAGPNGLTHFLPDGDRHDTAFGNPGPYGTALTGLLTDASGTLWIATGNGVASLTDQGVRIYRTAASEVFDVGVYGVEPDPRGGVWVGTLFAGIARFDGERWSPAEHSLNSEFKGGPLFNRSSVLSVDSVGNLWAATLSGLYKRGENGWMLYADTNSPLPNNEPSAVATGRDGKIWTMTGVLLSRYDQGEWKVYYPDAGGLLLASATGMCVAPDNALWISTEYEGVVRFDGTNWETFDNAAGLFNQNAAYTVVADPDKDVIWVGTKTGLARFDASGWTAVAPSFSDYPQGKTISSLTIDADGALWIGWFNNGVGRLTEEDFTLYTTANSGLTDNNVRDVAVDGEGNVWIATLYGGISVLENVGVSGVEENSKQQRTAAASRPELTVTSGGGDLRATLQLAQGERITIEIIDMLGRTVARPVSEEWFGAGSYTLPIRIETGAGMFFVRLQGEKGSVCRPVSFLPY